MKEEKSTLLSIFGARLSKDGKRLVLTLVSGEEEKRTYYKACIKLDNSQKTHAKVENDGEHALIKVKMLNDKKEKAQESDDVPF